MRLFEITESVLLYQEIEPDSPSWDDDRVLEYLSSEPRSTQDKCREITNKLGISCFSEHHPKSTDSFLMWAHYTNGHHGFCLEFDTADKPFSTAVDIDYDDNFPTIDFYRLWKEGDLDDAEVMKTLRTKSKHWEYEAEWRVFAKVF
ncbi:MAG: DUF2971 domain-containing protein [Pontiella sp.]